MKILIATNNEGKLNEIKEILSEYEIVSLKEIKCEIEVEENGKTFEENAVKKAKTLYDATKIPTIADDSGLEIEELGGFPGVLTARFLGEDKSGNEYSRERNEYILQKMKNIPKERRMAKHVTCIAYCDEQEIKVVRGEIEGYIANNPKGENGFGFDEIFQLENGKTYAEIGIEGKNKISSRKKALDKIREVI